MLLLHSHWYKLYRSFQNIYIYIYIYIYISTIICINKLDIIRLKVPLDCKLILIIINIIKGK